MRSIDAAAENAPLGKNWNARSAAFTLAAATADRVKENARRYDESTSGARYLNTPRLVANQSGQTVWRWDQTEPFGNNVPDENPSGLGTFEYPGRLPGQYADKETNLHYSYFRDCYDPATGRFCQPDPAGSVMFRDMGFRSIGALGLTRPDLADLLESEKPKYNHPYTYAKNNPLNNTDPLGLLSEPDVCSLQGCTFEFGFISPLNPAMTLCYYRCFGITGLVPYRPKMAWCPPNIPHPGGL